MGFYLLLFFIVSYFLHFTSRIPLLGTLRFDLVLMILLAVMALLSPKEFGVDNQDKSIRNRLTIFVSYFIFSIPLVKWPGSVLWFGLEFYLKVVLFFFFITALVKTEQQLKMFVYVFIGCQVFRGLEPVYLNITTGYLPEVAYSGGHNALARLAGAPHDVISANPYAWVIVTTIPFLYYLCFLGKSLLKLLTTIVVLFLGYGLVLSGSRTGLVILIVVVLAIIFLSQPKAKNAIISLSIIICIGYLVVGQLSPELAERYLSLVDSSAVGGDTAQGRINGIKTALISISNFNGLFGHGLGTSREVNANYFSSAQISHNIYIELLQEVGVLGFFLFCIYIKTIFKSLHDSSKMVDPKSYLGRLVLALKAWIVMDIVYGFACYGVSSWEWYVFGGISAACVSIIQKQKTCGAVTC